MTRAEAEKLRAIVEKAMAGANCDMISNHEAYEGRVLFPKNSDDFWDGHLVSTGQRIRWGDKLMAARSDLWATETNNPDNAPTLWEEIEYREGYRVLTGPISASNPVKPGEWCWEGDVLYECISPNVCTYRPSEYMAYWTTVE